MDAGWVLVPSVSFSKTAWTCPGGESGNRGRDGHRVSGWRVAVQDRFWCSGHAPIVSDFVTQAVKEFEDAGLDPANGLWFHAAAWGRATAFRVDPSLPRVVTSPGTVRCGRDRHPIRGLCVEDGSSWFCEEHAPARLKFLFLFALAGLYIQPKRQLLNAPSLPGPADYNTGKRSGVLHGGPIPRGF